MDAVWILSGAVIVSVVTALFRNRRAAASLNLGSVSREWVLRHSSE
jgi:hypothetical protein